MWIRTWLRLQVLQICIKFLLLHYLVFHVDSACVLHNVYNDPGKIQYTLKAGPLVADRRHAEFEYIFMHCPGEEYASVLHPCDECPTVDEIARIDLNNKFETANRYFNFDDSLLGIWELSSCIQVSRKDGFWNDPKSKNKAIHRTIIGTGIEGVSDRVYCRFLRACNDCLPRYEKLIADSGQNADIMPDPSIFDEDFLYSTDRSYRYDIANCYSDPAWIAYVKSAVCPVDLRIKDYMSLNPVVDKNPHPYYQNSSYVTGKSCPERGCPPPPDVSDGASKWASVSSFGFACFLLVIGKICRIHISFLSRIYMPVSMIAGLLGLFLVYVVQSLKIYTRTFILLEYMNSYSQISSFAINIVFCTMFLGRDLPTGRQIVSQSGRQFSYGMVVVFGQWCVSIIICGLVLIPLFNVHPLWASLLEVGFAGGHGTAVAFTDAFIYAQFPIGVDLSLATASVGLIMSILLGIIYINIAVQKGWMTLETEVINASVNTSHHTSMSISRGGVYDNNDKRPILGTQTTAQVSIDSFAWHVAVAGFVLSLALAIKLALIYYVEKKIDALNAIQLFTNFPIYPMCMVSSIITQSIISYFDQSDKFIDAETMNRISNTCLNFVIVCALSSMNLSSFASNLAPFGILMVTGIIWHCVCIHFIAPRFGLGPHWFERALAEMGQSMGVMASALTLICIVDKTSLTPVSADFCFKQILHAPFVGGGIFTVLSITLIQHIGIWYLFMICIAFLAGFLTLNFYYFKPRLTDCDCLKCKDMNFRLDDAVFDSSHTHKDSDVSYIQLDSMSKSKAQTMSTSSASNSSLYAHSDVSSIMLTLNPSRESTMFGNGSGKRKTYSLFKGKKHNM